MAYQRIVNNWDAIPLPCHDPAQGLAYRPPRPPRPLEATGRRPKPPVIVLSDDEFEYLQHPTTKVQRQSLHHENEREVISIDSESDDDADIAIVPRPSHKRTRNPGSSPGGSPYPGRQAGGKRRETPADARAMKVYPILSQKDYPMKQDRRGLRANDDPNSYQVYAPGLQKKNEEADEPPYYADGRFGIRMYRGPGYEKYPVALGTVDGHQEICDKWDADQLAKNAKHLAYFERANGDIVWNPREEADKASFDKKILDSVIDVFPDIERAFVERMIREAPPQPSYSSEDDEELCALGQHPLAQTIIAGLLELQSYPKEPSPKPKKQVEPAAGDGTGLTITWDRDIPHDESYLKDATILIAKQFPHVPTCFIDQVVRDKKSIFDTYITLQDLEARYYTIQPKPYPRRKQARTELEKKYQLTYRDITIPAEYAHRVNELQAARQHLAREVFKDAAKKAKAHAEASNLAEHIKSGAIVECRCCFDAETPLNRVVPCTAEEPHYFCFNCVEMLANAQVGMLQYKMECMDVGECKAALSHEYVGRAIPITTFDRLELNQQQAEILAANIEGLEQCPHCDYRAVCGKIEDESIFFCQNPECSRASCRKCQKDDHTPVTCEEAGVDKVLSARHEIEEARSAAIIRTCRNCKSRIIKDFGCNKMTCSRCKSYFCYNCNEDITHLGANGGDLYSHFRNGKCATYDEGGEDRHEFEAAEAEKAAIQKAKALNPGLDEKALQIDAEKPKTTRTRPEGMQNLLNHPAGGAFIRNMNDRAGRLNRHQLNMRNLQQRVAHLEALRPDPRLDALLGRIHAMNNAYGANGNPPPADGLPNLVEPGPFQRVLPADGMPDPAEPGLFFQPAFPAYQQFDRWL